jgi:hypothetical protein
MKHPSRHQTPPRPALVPFRGIGVNTGLPTVAGLGAMGVVNG